MIKVGINGFGRIGRLSFRIIVAKHSGEVEIGAINTSGSMNVEGWAHLARYDTMYRRFEKQITSNETQDPEKVTDESPEIRQLVVDGKNIPVLAQKDPSKIPWGKYGVDVVIESTGRFTTEEDAKKHAQGGAKRVVISAPGKGGNVGTYVLGVNEAKPD